VKRKSRKVVGIGYYPILTMRIDSLHTAKWYKSGRVRVGTATPAAREQLCRSDKLA